MTYIQPPSPQGFGTPITFMPLFAPAFGTSLKLVYLLFAPHMMTILRPLPYGGTLNKCRSSLR